MNNNLNPLIIFQKSINRSSALFSYNSLIRVPYSNLIFLDIPKCASSSLKWYLRDRLSINSLLDLFNISTSYPHAIPLPHVSRFNNMNANDDTLRVALVRNPLHRLFSTFKEKVFYEKGFGYGKDWIYSGFKYFGKRSGKVNFNEFIVKITSEQPGRLDKHIRPYSVIISDLPEHLRPNIFIDTCLLTSLFSVMDSRIFTLSKSEHSLDTSFTLNQTGSTAFSNTEIDRSTHDLIKKYYKLDYSIFSDAIRDYADLDAIFEGKLKVKL